MLSKIQEKIMLYKNVSYTHVHEKSSRMLAFKWCTCFKIFLPNFNICWLKFIEINVDQMFQQVELLQLALFALRKDSQTLPNVRNVFTKQWCQIQPSNVKNKMICWLMGQKALIRHSKKLRHHEIILLLSRKHLNPYLSLYSCWKNLL